MALDLVLFKTVWKEIAGTLCFTNTLSITSKVSLETSSVWVAGIGMHIGWPPLACMEVRWRCRLCANCTGLLRATTCEV